MHHSMQTRKTSLPHSTASPVGRDEMHATISSAFEAGLFFQVDAAQDLGIDQGQISKIVAGHFVRPTGRAAELFAYVNLKIAGQGKAPAVSSEDAPALRAMLISKLLGTWDETPSGAQALGMLLDAAKQLKNGPPLFDSTLGEV